MCFEQDDPDQPTESDRADALEWLWNNDSHNVLWRGQYVMDMKRTPAEVVAFDIELENGKKLLAFPFELDTEPVSVTARKQKEARP